VGGSTIYKGRTGQWSFIGHRVSGFLVFFFLLLHIIDISLIRFNGGELYDEVHKLYGNVFLRLFTLGLLFALLFHAMNGLRIIIVDFFPRAVRNERMLTGWVLLITLAAGIPASVVIMWPWVEGTF
jgi:succinate dehydrogenase / fumarate reductase cytochrome b subunit